MKLSEYFRRYFHEPYLEPIITVVPGRRGPRRPKLQTIFTTHTMSGSYPCYSVFVRAGWLKARYPLSCAVARLTGTPLEDMEIHPQELPVI